LATSFLQKNPSLQHRSFRAYLALRFLLILGLNLQFAAVAYFTYKVTDHTPQGPEYFLGMLGLAEVIPAIFGSFFTGHFADQREKRGLVRAAVLAYLALSLVYLIPARPSLQAALGLGWTMTIIYSAVFIGGLARALWSPSAFALVGLLVPRPQLQNATTWSSMAWQSGAVLGPLAAGLLIGFAGYSAAFGTVTGLVLGAAVLVHAIPPQRVVKTEREPVLAGVRQGLRYVFSTQVVLAALSLDMFAVLFGGATALLPVYANEILHVGATGFGWLRAATGIGSVITLLALSFIPLKTHAGWKLGAALVGFGICTIVFGVSTSFPLSMAMLLLIGIFDGLSVVIRSTILQLKTPEAMRGRVAAVNTMFVSSSNEIGALESGLAARWLGTVPSVVAGGVAVLATVVVTYLAAPKLRSLDLSAEAEKEKPGAA